MCIYIAYVDLIPTPNETHATKQKIQGPPNIEHTKYNMFTVFLGIISPNDNKRNLEIERYKHVRK